MAPKIVLSAVVERLQRRFTAESFKDVKRHLDLLRRLLDDDEAIYKHMTDENVGQLEKILYMIEDLVESHPHQVGIAPTSEDIMRNILQGMRGLMANHKFRTELSKLTDQIEVILVPFQNDNLVSTPETSNLVPAPETSQGSSNLRDNVTVLGLPRISTLFREYGDGEHMIERERDEEELVSALTEGSRRLEVVPICGMGGTGKTTLARTAYNNLKVRDHFDVRAWHTITQEFQIRDIFLSILSQLRRSDSDQNARTDDMMDLAEGVYKYLKGRKWLVVLDDVWSIEAWERIKLVFPDDGNGSRILVTTRNRAVASSMSGEGRIHSMAPFDEGQSWELFKRRAQLTDSISGSASASQREQIANEIAIQCGGLPLAIVVLADILKTTPFDQWNSLLRDIEKVKTSKTHVVEALPMDLIYNGLPSVLKPCLLYMGTFPKGSKIEVDTICQLWIAEGLVSEERCGNGEIMMERAGSYFDELASRNLVQVPEEEISTHQSFRYGSLLNLTRDICILKAKEEDFFEIVKLRNADQLKDSVFRCAIYLDKHETTEIRPCLRSDLRSLLFFNSCLQSGEDLIRPGAMPNLSNLKRIRILHFDGVHFRGGSLLPGVENLVLLRHLSLRDCYLRKLPPYIGNFLFLITLDLRVEKCCNVIIPNVLCKLQNLRHLYLPLKFQTPNHDKLQLYGLIALEILENFDAGICNAEDIIKLTELRHLVVNSEGNLEDLQKILDRIKHKKIPLNKTSLDIRNFESYTEKRLAFIKELFSCHFLHILGLEGRIGKMPELDAASGSLTEIHLNGSLLEDDPMQTLKVFLKLRILVLESEAYIGKKMYWSNSGFPELRSLKLSKLYNLETWEVEIDAMPKLSTLTIENCRRMKELPEKLECIKGLRKLKVNMMSKEFVGRLREVDGKGGEDLYKINTNCTIEFGSDNHRPESTDSTTEMIPKH